MLPKTVQVFLLRKHTYNLLNSQKILQDSYLPILFKSHKNSSSSLTIYCSYLKSFPTIRDITSTRKLTKLTLVLVLIPYSYFKTRLCDKDRWKKVQKLSPFSFQLSLKALFDRRSHNSVTTEVLINGSYMDTNCSSSCACKMSNFTS